MKQYFLKFSGAALLLSLVAAGALAQEGSGATIKPDKATIKSDRSDLIIIKTTDGKDTKVTIEVKDGDVKVNGRPLSEFKDDNVTITKRKQLTTMNVNGSRFRTNDAFNFNGDASSLGDLAPLFVRGYALPAFLGVTTEKEGDGARITTIENESAAEKVGLKEGDIIIRINDQKINDPEDLSRTIGKHKPEEKVNVVFTRGGKEQTLAVTLGKRKTMNYAYSGGDMVVNGFPMFRGKLGLKAQETEEGKGLKVLDVDDDSPAATAGIKEGDIITEFDGTEVNDIDKLREVGHAASAKVSFKVKIIRDGKSQEITVKIPKNLKTTNL